MTKSCVSAVVIHWNQGEACADTVARLDSEPLVGSIIVVDNGSRSDELSMVEAAAKTSGTRCSIVQLNVNTGFGPATNRGWERWLETESNDWCLTLPHDAQAGPGTIQALLSEAVSEPSLGLVSADVGDGMLPIVDKNFGPIFRPQRTSAGLEPCDYPHGTMFLARRTCLETVGLYDERFFTYCEEADLGLRAKAAGWGVGLVRGARVFNPVVSTPRAVAGYLMERNTLLLVRKHFGPGPFTVRMALSVWNLVRGLAQPSTRTEYWSTRARLLALRDALIGRSGAPPSSLI